MKQITVLADSSGTRAHAWPKVWNRLGWADVNLHGRGGLTFLDAHFPAEVLDPPEPKPVTRPELFIVQLMANDAIKHPETLNAAQHKLQMWCSRLVAMKMPTVFVLPFNYSHSRERMTAWRTMIVSTVKQHGGAYCSTYNMPLNEKQMLDLYHPNPLMHTWQAMALGARLKLIPEG